MVWGNNAISSLHQQEKLAKYLARDQVLPHKKVTYEVISVVGSNTVHLHRNPLNTVVLQGHTTSKTSDSYKHTCKATPPEGSKRSNNVQTLCSLREGWLHLQTKYHIRIREF